MSAAYALQKALRARLVGTAAVTALVPASSILDRNTRPAPDPSIILGEDQAVDEGGIARTKQRIYATVHVWKKEPGVGGAKSIAGALRSALSLRLEEKDGFQFADCRVSSERFLRDPDGEFSHGVVTIEALAVEAT